MYIHIYIYIYIADVEVGLEGEADCLLRSDMEAGRVCNQTQHMNLYMYDIT